MQQENNQPATKEDTKELKSLIKEGFTAMDEKIDNVEKCLEDRIDNLENKIDRRMSDTEDRVRVVKNVVEKGFKTKVA